MNDRQRLQAIVAVVCKYLPPNGISRENALREIIGLVDPLPESNSVALKMVYGEVCYQSKHDDEYKTLSAGKYWLEQGWYTAEQLQDIINVHNRMNEHLRKSMQPIKESK